MAHCDSICRSLLGGLILTFSIISAAKSEDYVIKNYTKPEIPIYDENGNPTGEKKPASELPKGATGELVNGINLICLKSSLTPPRTCFLDRYLEVTLIPSTQETVPCVPIQGPSESDLVAVRGIGGKSSCGK